MENATTTTNLTKVIMAIIVTLGLAAGVVAGVVVNGGSRAGASKLTDEVGQPIEDDGERATPEPIDDETPTIDVGEDAEVVEQADGTTTVTGTVEIPTAAGPVELDDADLVIEEGPDGEPIIVGGTAEVPFPTTGILENAVINHLPKGLVGTDYGRDLHHLGAHLQDDRLYMWFHFDGGLDVELPFAGEPGYEALPAAIEIPTGVTATMVLDPNDPYFYVGMPCPDLDTEDEDDKDNDKKDEDKDKSDDDKKKNDEEDTTKDDDKTDDQDTKKNDENEDEDEETLITLEPIGGVGQDCGLGFSLQGMIPAPAVEGLEPFFGHIVVDGIIPLPSAMELDGSVVVEVREDKVRTSGFGELSATIPLIDTLLDIELPIGDATVDLQAGGGRLSLGFEGQVGGNEPTYELPIIGVPFTLPTNGTAEASALVAWNIDADGRWTIDRESHLEITGEMTMTLLPFADALGVDLAAQSIDAMLRIDGDGAYVAGSTELTLHPALQSGAGMHLETFLSFRDFSESYLTFDGELVVAGVTLGDASVDLSQHGLFVSGMLTNTIATVELQGEISSAGVNLSGTQTIEFPLDVLSRISDGATAAIDDAQAEVDRLQGAIEAMREQVRKERRLADTTLQGWIEALEEAQRDLDEIDDNIASNKRKIESLRDKKDAEKRRFKNLNLAEQGLQLVKHNARLAGWNTEIGYLTAENGIQFGYKETASLALEAAQAGIRLAEDALDAIPVDIDPRIVGLIAAKETATAVLQTARAAAEIIDVSGTLRGQITWQLGTAGISGSVVAEYCGTSCTTLAGGSVTLLPTPEACVELFDIEVCASL